MKRLLVTGPQQVSFEESERPACADDGVVLRASLTAISTGTELRVYRAIPVDEAGQFLHERVPFQLPTENGYSMVGRVVEVGAHVTSVAVGDRLFAAAGHQQFAAASAESVTRLPESVPDEEAVLLNILEVGHKALRQGNPPAGSNVAIVGQGVVGLSLLAYATAFGFRTAVLDVSEERLQISRAMGADLAISPDASGAVDQVLELFDGAGADVTFEAASHWSAVRTAMEVAALDGTVVLVSRHTANPGFNPAGHPFLGKRLNLVTTYDYPSDSHRWSRRRSIDLTVDLLARRRLRIGPMLTHRFAWQDLPEAYRRLDQGDRTIAAAIIEWENGDRRE